MTRTILTFVVCFGLFSCSVKNPESPVEQVDTTSTTSLHSNLPDKNFSLVEDFEQTIDMFTRDTFDLPDVSAEGGQLIAFHTRYQDYMVIDIWVYGEMGKSHATYWTDKQLNFIIVQQTYFVYDKPSYEEGYKVEETTEFYSYSGNSFKRYNADKQEINNPDNVESEKKIKDFFADITKDIEIIK